MTTDKHEFVESAISEKVLEVKSKGQLVDVHGELNQVWQLLVCKHGFSIRDAGSLLIDVLKGDVFREFVDGVAEVKKKQTKVDDLVTTS